MLEAAKAPVRNKMYCAIVVKTIRVFAWVALSIGFSIVVWIIYAMLFAYR